MIPSLQSMTKLGNLMPKSALKSGVKLIKAIIKPCLKPSQETLPKMKQQAEALLSNGSPISAHNSSTVSEKASSSNNVSLNHNSPATLQGILKNSRTSHTSPTAQTFANSEVKNTSFKFLKSPSQRQKEAEEIHKIIKRQYPN